MKYPAVKIWEWMNNFISHFTGRMFTYMMVLIQSYWYQFREDIVLTFYLSIIEILFIVVIFASSTKSKLGSVLQLFQYLGQNWWEFMRSDRNLYQDLSSIILTNFRVDAWNKKYTQVEFDACKTFSSYKLSYVSKRDSGACMCRRWTDFSYN